MNRSSERTSRAILLLFILLGLAGTVATRCGGDGSNRDTNASLLLAVWMEMPHPAPECVNDGASIPLITDGTVQDFATGPRETVFHFATGANGAQVTVTNVGPCDLYSSYFRCDSDGYLRGDEAGISCVPAASSISGTGASRTCTFSQSNVRIVPWYGGPPQGCAYQVRVVHL